MRDIDIDGKLMLKCPHMKNWFEVSWIGSSSELYYHGVNPLLNVP
jgi:hypothetical protein